MHGRGEGAAEGEGEEGAWSRMEDVACQKWKWLSILRPSLKRMGARENALLGQGLRYWRRTEDERE